MASRASWPCWSSRTTPSTATSRSGLLQCARLPGGRGGGRRGGGRGLRPQAVRRRAHGLPDAAGRRLRGDAAHPRDRGRTAPPHARDRPDRERDEAATASAAWPPGMDDYLPKPVRPQRPGGRAASLGRRRPRERRHRRARAWESDGGPLDPVVFGDLRSFTSAGLPDRGHRPLPVGDAGAHRDPARGARPRRLRLLHAAAPTACAAAPPSWARCAS